MKNSFKEKRDDILRLDSQGKTVNEIYEILFPNLDKKLSYSAIRRYIIRNDSSRLILNRKSKFDKFYDEVKSLINNGVKTKEIASILNVNASGLESWIKSRFSNISFIPTISRPDYFNKIDSYTKAYIYGFISADGSIVDNGNGSLVLTITIKKDDVSILELIKSELGSNHNIQDISRESNMVKCGFVEHKRLAFSNKEISNRLIELGIVQRKSLIIKDIIKNVPYQFRDAFTIGYFDANGSVSINKNIIKKNGKVYPDHSLYITIRSTKELLSGICEHLNIDKSHIRQYDSIPTLSFANKRDVVRFFKCYQHLDFYLKRKHDIFLKKINHESFDKYKQD